MIAVFFCAAVFGFGLGFSHLLDPGRIQDFLDVAGAWNPGPLFVMGGAVLIYAVGFRLVVRRPKPLLAPKFQLPQATRVDAKLVGGAALFGVGWGLCGYCPGPALAGLSLGFGPTALVVIAMVAGAIVTRRLSR